MSVVHLEKTASTNDEARKLGLDGAPHGTIVVAKQQTGGRGRLGRRWYSPPGGLWLSFIARPSAPITEPLPPVSIAAGLAAAKTVDFMLDSLGCEKRAGLSWPNDVMIDDKKIAGILCEICCRAPGELFFIAGIGINVNNSPDDLPEELRTISTSVSALAGKQFSLESALDKIATLLDNEISATLEKRDGLQKVIEGWKMKSILFGRKVRIQAPGTEWYEAEPFDIDECGRLLVKDGQGRERTVEFEETTLIR